jgi:hypothetical protein
MGLDRTVTALGQKRPSANLLRQVWFDIASGHLGYRLVPASTASSTPQQISNGNLLSASSGRHLLSRRCVRIFGSEGPTPSNPLPQIPAAFSVRGQTNFAY